MTPDPALLWAWGVLFAVALPASLLSPERVKTVLWRIIGYERG